MNDFSFLFAYIAKFSIVLPFLIYILYKNKKNKVSITVFILLCITALGEIINEIYVRTGHRGVIVYNLSFIVQFMVICTLYKRLLEGKYTKLITGGLTLFLIFFVVATPWFQDINKAQNWVWVLGDIIAMLYGSVHLFYLYKTMKRQPSIFSNGRFWITIALMTWHC